MTKSMLFRLAHKNTKEVKKVYSEITFEKKGLTFTFIAKEIRRERLKLDWKVEGNGVEEGTSKLGLHKNAILDEKKAQIRFEPGFKLNGKNVNGVKLTAEINKELNDIRLKMMSDKKEKEEEIIKNIIDGKIKIKFISVGCDYVHYIATLDIKDSKIDGYNLIEKAIKKFGFSTTCEGLKYSEVLKNHNANEESSVYYTLEECLSKQFMLRKEKEDKKERLIKLAKDTGEKQVWNTWSEKCNSKYEECDIDIVTEYIDENGKMSSERIHTY